MSPIRQLLTRIATEGSRRAKRVTATFLGRERVFFAYDVGADTFIVEKGLSSRLDERPSVLMVEKRHLRRRARGRVMTLTTGNHAVATFPLLDGRFWKLSTLPPARRGDVLTRFVLCANVVGGTIEISQRDVTTADLVSCDAWLRDVVGLSRDAVVMSERNEMTLEHYRRQGEEWRVKPLAWTATEMRTALAASRKRIGTRLHYYHSARGVHFLTCAEFVRFTALAETDPEAFIQGLRELVSVYEGNATSFVRMPKYRGHHEIELFGLLRGVALQRIVPEIERLMEAVVLQRTGQLGIIQKAQEIAARFRSLLSSPELADESSKAFVESLYMHITGEVYAVVGDGAAPAFDDRRTALPGATFVSGRPVLHPGADDRTEVLLSNLRGMMSKDEVVEYANVYELRTGSENARLGCGSTREVVYKTNRRPLEDSLVEKRLSRTANGYGSYVLARIGALRSLGVSMSDFYLLLKRRAGLGRRLCDYYIRRRCEGEPMEAIPATYFRRADDAAAEDRDVVLALAALMGDAAAQNMAMKKYDAETQGALYGVGKEIYEFEYDIVHERVVPKKVSTCSIRGSFGWPCLAYTEENLERIADFYMGHYAEAIRRFRQAHPEVALDDIAARFMDGFAFRTQALDWQLSVMRDQLESFDPDVPRRYGFVAKWRFLLWSLERQERRLPILRRKLLARLSPQE